MAFVFGFFYQVRNLFELQGGIFDISANLLKIFGHSFHTKISGVQMSLVPLSPIILTFGRFQSRTFRR